MEILSSRELQRLQFLRQMGVAWLGFPSASQTRFAHSVGVYALGEMALSRAGIKTAPDAVAVPLWKWAHALDLDEEFLAALLLHDVGHFPYSHLLEPLFPEITHEELGAALVLLQSLAPEVRLRGIYESHLKDVLPGGGSEDASGSRGDLLSRRLSRSFREVSLWVVAWLIGAGHLRGTLTGLEEGQLVEGIRRDREAGIHRATLGDLRVLKCMVSGLLDLDRFDHYQRDSFFSGVKIATFNFRSFIHGVTFHVGSSDSDPVVELTQDAASQAVAMLEARENISKSVFNAADPVSYSLMFRRALQLHIESLGEEGSSRRLKWLFFTDDELLYELRRSGSATARALVDLIMTARPYRLVARATARLDARIASPADLERRLERIAKDTLDVETPHGEPPLLWELPREVTDASPDPGNQWLDLSRLKVDSEELSMADRETYDYLKSVRRSGRRQMRFFLHPQGGRVLPEEFRSRCEPFLSF